MSYLFFRRVYSIPVVLCILFVSSPVYAAWIQKDLGTIQGLQGMTQAGNAMITAGNTGNILRSTDDGKTWQVADKNASVYWQDVDTRNGIVRVVGESGAMRESTDNGVSWSSVTLGISQNIYDIETSGAYGFLVGSGGRLMSLHPYAKIWQTISSPTTLSLQRIQMVSDSTVWIVGYEGILLYSSDYGINWINKGKVADANLFGVWFSSPTAGYVVGKNGTFRKTTDAGVSWSNVGVSGLVSQTLYDIRASGDQMIVVGDKIILRSQNAGATWTAYDYSLENYTFKNSYFDASGNAWVVGTKDDVKSVIVKDEAAPLPTAPVQDDTNSVIPSAPEAAPNSLIKLACAVQTSVNDPCTAVYFYGSDGKRHAFPNEKVFFTWYGNFDGVVNVSSKFMSSLALGKNVTSHPGTRMVKFQSVQTVYTVSKGGLLRAVASEELAAQLYGTDWNKKIDDISDAFYGNYTFGSKIQKATDYDVVSAQTSITGLDQNF